VKLIAVPKLRSRIEGLLPALTPAERRVAELVLGDQADAALTITELAAAAETSPSTVVRFCRTLGLAGYPDLRMTMARDSGRAAAEHRPEFGSDIGEDDDVPTMIAKIAAADADAVEQTAVQLDPATLSRVITAIDEARAVVVYGMGASTFVAADLHQKLERIGCSAATSVDPHQALTQAALLGPGDVLVGISHTGTTEDVAAVMAEARSHGARTVALTNFPRSRVASQGDEVLTTAVRETTFRSGAMASRIAQLTVIDCVFIGVAQRRRPEALRALEITRTAVLRRAR
jgi:DNA-binding MurR/RpiR family transcriptional regulator